MDATAIAPTYFNWLKAAGFTPTAVAFLERQHLSTPFEIFKMDEEEEESLYFTMRRTWGIGDTEVAKLKGYVAGVNQMAEWLNSDR